jgi:hypothetical protein
MIGQDVLQITADELFGREGALVNRSRGEFEFEMGAPLGRKEEVRIAMCGPELPEEFESA